MKRRSGIIGVVVLLCAAGVVAWRCSATRTSSSPKATTTNVASTSGSAAGVVATKRPDPKTLKRGSIAGTVTDDGKGPIAGAHVCAAGSSREISDELFVEPFCATTDAQGRYTIANLLPAKYNVSASAKTFRPGVHHPMGDKHERELPLAAGEAKQDVDIALRGGGVEITGVVLDLTGGAVAHAKVLSGGGWGDNDAGTTYGEADDQGAFSLWVKPGDTWVGAHADGYADGSAQAHAPGKVEILLTPESSLSGTVVDALSGTPIEGARVAVGASTDWGWDDTKSTVLTDSEGKFRATRLTPGRYVAIAQTERGFGRTEGSTLVGLGQNVDGVVVKMWKAHRIEGKVMIATKKTPCEHPYVSLREETKNRWLETHEDLGGGVVVAEAVLPGTYSVSAGCRGYQSRDKYEPVTITDKDVTGLVWEVDEGATVRGKVLAKSGEPMEDVEIWASSVGGAAREREGWSNDSSGRDGTYELTGLKPGSYKLETRSDRGLAPKDGFKVDVAAGATVQKDLVLEDGGTIKGTVVDSEGAPVSGVDINAQATAAMMWSWGGGDHKSDDTGSFQIDSLRPGNYRVTARRSWSDELRKPGTTDDAKQGEKAVVRANETSVVKLVVESQKGVIKGTVVDTEGKPVADAYVSAARESDAAGAQRSSVQATRWSWDEKPVLTSVDGAFTVSKLSPGTYTVRAFRKGGGEAVAEHVAVGSTASLQIKATGSMTGVAKSPDKSPDELTIALSDPLTGFSRSEKFFKTNGQFVVRDLPKGHFRITASGDSSQKQIELDLAEGEAKTGVVIELDALVTLTGRLVELGTQTPVAGMQMMASLASGGRFMFSSGGDDRTNITDEAGRFTIKNAPRGKLSIRGFPKNWDDEDMDYGQVSTVRTVDGTGTIDIGDIGILKKRIKKGDPVGELGVNFAEQPRDTLPDKRELKVSFVDPAGPAAKTDLKVGDIVTTCDGIDVSGASSSNWYTLRSAPPGTKLVLGLARGAKVEVTLAAP